tara:strand:+ start:1861 stop:2001 length:141 start_codon:yes stop_codon:yes gene_type:complete
LIEFFKWGGFTRKIETRDKFLLDVFDEMSADKEPYYLKTKKNNFMM